ncbi:MAG: HNH endonuclease [Methanobrevibacter sp. CfCl-M3]
MTIRDRWQVPGNGNPFDSKLEDWKNPSSKMSQRSIGVLKFINNAQSITKKDFEKNIWDYLEKKFQHQRNDSNIAHFYRPLEFVGLIRNIDNNLSISIDGKNFLNEIHQEKYEKATEFYILQLLKSSYPNSATKDISLGLFPFRIIFKMLLDNPIDKNWFKTKIPYITNIEDIKNLKDIENPPYAKWYSWVLSYLLKWSVLDDENGFLKINEDYNNFINGFLVNMGYEDMFFSSDETYLKQKNNLRQIKRDRKVTCEVLKENDYRCFINENHRTFPTATATNYVEGHHIIPISLKDSFEKNLDCEDNIIPLCPNCHKEIHFAINKCKNRMLIDIFERKDGLKMFGINIDDLREIYFK